MAVDASDDRALLGSGGLGCGDAGSLLEYVTGHRIGRFRSALVRRAVAVATLAVIALGASAAPASAHALLLTSDPAGGAIVANPPTVIRLHFSETVSVPFGAIRLIDPSGRPVTTGPPRVGQTDRDVVVAVPALSHGSYDLAWQILDSDGHLTGGDFIFHVGAPSGTPPRAGQRVRPSSLFGPLSDLVRFTWVLAFMFLVGAAVVRRFVWTPAVRATGSVESPLTETFRRRFGPALRLSWMILVAAGCFGLLVESATVTVGPLWSSLQPSVLGRLLGTTYGHLWIAQMTLTLLIGPPVYALSDRPWGRGVSSRSWLKVGTVLAGGLAATTALGGHARTASRPVLTTAFLALHIVAAAVWVGGLAALVVLAIPGWRSVPDTRQAWKLKPVLLREVLRRFSRVAMISVAVLVVSGVIAAAGDLGHPGNLWRVAYGQVLMVKIVLLVASLGFGAWHLMGTSRRLTGPGERTAVGGFERTSAAEAFLLLAAIGAAAILVGLVPGRALDLTGGGPVSQRQQAGAYTAELFIASPGVGPNEVHVSFTNGEGLLAGEVATVSASLRGPTGGAKPVDLQIDAPGHFSGIGSFPLPGLYRLSVSEPGGGKTLFGFQVATVAATG
jgi:copper transport protein